MMRNVMLAGWLVLVSAGAAVAQMPPEAVVDRYRMQEQLAALETDVTTLEALNEGQQNPRLRARVADRLNVMRSRVRRLQNQLQRAPMLGPPVPQAPPPPQAPVVMGALEFNRFHQAVEDAAFGADKLALINESCQYNHFTSAHVVDIVELMPHSSDKVEAAATMFPRVVDPQNFFEVYAHIPFSTDKEKLRARIGANR